MKTVIKHTPFSSFREDRIAEAIRDAFLSSMSELDSARFLINIEDRYFFRAFCRPTVGDAARVIGCDVDVLACALASAGCIEYDPESKNGCILVDTQILIALIISTIAFCQKRSKTPKNTELEKSIFVVFSYFYVKKLDSVCVKCISLQNKNNSIFVK